MNKTTKQQKKDKIELIHVLIVIAWIAFLYWGLKNI